jgi:enoyl-CoA hydratase
VTDTPQFKRTKMSRTGRTAVLALASDKVNALDQEVLLEITAFIEVCEQDPGIGALVVTGEGSVFSAGLNVNELISNDKTYADVLLDAFTSALLRVFNCPKPTIAAINGSAIAGGCLLACVFDKRLIAEEARIGVTELRVGVSFPVMAVELLRHVCGPRAEQLMLNAELLDAHEACAYGLAHHFLPRADLQAAAMSAAEQLMSLDVRAYELAKVAARRAVLSNIEENGTRSLDQQVRDHWRDDQTRDSLRRLLGPKD